MITITIQATNFSQYLITDSITQTSKTLVRTNPSFKITQIDITLFEIYQPDKIFLAGIEINPKTYVQD